MSGNTAPPSLPAAFIDAFDGLLAGHVSLEFARRSLIAALEDDVTCGPAMQTVLEQAYEETRLSDEDYEALNGELLHALAEDIPTDWSDAAPVAEQRSRPDAGSPAGALTRNLERTANPLYPGAVLRERFVLQARIGAGGMAEVYKALDRRRQESGAPDPFVAVKLVNPSFTDHARAVAILQHESAVGQRLLHPNILRVLDFDRDGEHAFLTMEWLDGESLAELLNRLRYRPVHSGRGRKIIEDISGALCHAHAQGVVHGDVKPGNILLPAGGPAKLLDFGAAREAVDGAHDEDGNSGRTPAYASCEVLEGQACTPQDDLFSLACVAYRMLAGRRAFGRLSALEAERAGWRAARIPHITAGQWAALEHALAFRRPGRHADVAAFLREFRGYTETAAAREPAVTPATRAVEPAAPDRRRGIATGIVLAALSIMAAMTLFRSPSPTGTVRSAATTVRAPVAPAAPVTSPPAPPLRQQAATIPGTAKPGWREIRATPTVAAPKPSRAATNVASAGTPALDSPVEPPTAALVTPPPPEATTAAASSATGAGVATVALSELKFTRYVEPEEPQGVRSFRAGGWVVVSFRVDEYGRTGDVAVTDADPKGRYETSALTAVRRWRFEPPREDGRPVSRQTSVRLRFQP